MLLSKSDAINQGVAHAGARLNEVETSMSEVTIHLYCRLADGTIEDAQHTFDLSDFGGFLPAVGDKILDPGCQHRWSAMSPRTVACGPLWIGFSIHATPRTSSLW